MIELVTGKTMVITIRIIPVFQETGITTITVDPDNLTLISHGVIKIMVFLGAEIIKDDLNNVTTRMKVRLFTMQFTLVLIRNLLLLCVKDTVCFVIFVHLFLFVNVFPPCEGEALLDKEAGAGEGNPHPAAEGDEPSLAAPHVALHGQLLVDGLLHMRVVL